MKKRNKSNLWKAIFISLFLIVSIISFYEFILSYDPFKLFLGVVFLLVLIYEIFSLKGNYNKIFWFLMIAGTFALYLIVFYSYFYAVYELISPFFLIQVFLAGIMGVGLFGLFWEGRGSRK